MKKPYQILLSERQLEMINELKEKTGTTTVSGILFQALTELHKSYETKTNN